MRQHCVLLLLSAIAAFADNPVLPGDHPDPSVIRVGNTYWATATTSAWAPIFPLLKSTDLQNWTNTGAVFQQRPAWADTNFWAPEIAADKDRYFVYYTAKKRGGPLCVAVADAPKPDGPYTDHGPLVCQEAGSIDAVPVTDEEGQRWLIWKEDGNSRRQPTPLWAQRLTPDGLHLTGEMHKILQNDVPWEGAVVEGPFFVRRNGWWYLFYSGAGCCGRGCTYALGVARAKKLLGPWEKNPANPILKANDQWSCPGHGSIVDDGRGRTWLLYHAYHPKDFIYLGRQGLLDEVLWPDGGWPVIKGPSAGSYPKLRPVNDTFTGSLSPEWTWPARQEAAAITRDGVLELTAHTAEAVLARLPTAADYTAETAVIREGNEQSGGIAAWGSSSNALGLTVDNSGALKLWRRDKGVNRTLAVAKTTAPVVHLRMTATNGKEFAFAYSNDGKTWTVLNPDVSGESLPPWDLATRIALYASPSAKFDYLRIR